MPGRVTAGRRAERPGAATLAFDRALQRAFDRATPRTGVSRERFSG
jgi:hypothetical protein